MSYANMNSKWMKGINIRGGKATKLPEEKTEEELHDPGFGNGFSGVMLKAEVRKEQDLIKTRKLCASKDTLDCGKATPGMGREICKPST